VDHVGDGVKICEGEAGLSFLWWEIVGCVVAESLDQFQQILADSVVGIVGSVTVAERESVAKVLLVFCEDCEGGVDGRPWCLCHNGLADIGALIADVLDQVAELVCGECLQQSRKRQRSACRCVGASSLDGAMCAV
jgi:hypothetical protein